MPTRKSRFKGVFDNTLTTRLEYGTNNPSDRQVFVERIQSNAGE
jgi:hypothetical protein